MAKLYLWCVVGLLVCVVSPGVCDDVGAWADVDRGFQQPDGLWDTVKASSDQEVPVLESQNPSQPPAPASANGDRDTAPFVNSVNGDTNQEAAAQGIEGLSPNNQVYDSLKDPSASSSKQNGLPAAGMPDAMREHLSQSTTHTEVGNGQEPQHEEQMSKDSVNSQNRADSEFMATALESPLTKSNTSNEAQNAGTQGQEQNRQDDNGYNAQYNTNRGDVDVLGNSGDHFSENIWSRKEEHGQGNEGQVQNSQDAAGLNTLSNHANEANGVLGSQGDPIADRTQVISQTEMKKGIQTQDNLDHASNSAQNIQSSSDNEPDAGSLLDTSYIRPSPSEGGNRNQIESRNISNSIDNIAPSTSSSLPAMPGENVDSKGVRTGVDSEEPRAESSSGNFVMGSQQPQFSKTPDQHGDEVDQGNKDIPLDSNLGDENKGKQTEGATENRTEASKVTPPQPVSIDPDNKMDIFDDDFDYEDDEDDDDWWYYNPDSRKKDRTTSSALPSSSTTMPWPVDSDEQLKEGKTDESSATKGDLSDLHEGIIEIADVVDKNKKKMNGPRDAIILYTGLIIILVCGIVVFTLWKNSSKKSRSRNLISVPQNGEEGKRLLDHPFV
ncbi:uncharacterized protein LOC143292902 isoform X2 [Babylonia areolata]|uniref:uncharacterized protein LOC143292902 isoform X2 n=1 Tax=Babylonia areolata TaxID=304850 RepID=UPI003FD226B6